MKGWTSCHSIIITIVIINSVLVLEASDEKLNMF